MRMSSQPVVESGHSDVLAGDTLAFVSEESLALFNRLPTLLQWGEVPSFTCGAHDPETAFVSVECQAPADGKGLDDLVNTQWCEQKMQVENISM